MNLKNIVVFNNPFLEAFQKLLRFPLPAGVSLKLVQTFKAISEQQSNVFQVRDNLLERYGKVEKGKPIFNSKEDEQLFHTEMNNLLKLEFEVPINQKIKLTDSINISGEEILLLKDILDVDL